LKLTAWTAPKITTRLFATTRTTCITGSSGWSIADRTGRFAETTAITLGLTRTTFWPGVVTTRPVIPTSFTGGGLVLRPLRAEAEALELGEIDLVEILGRILV
jgi:hypothetical protein